MKTFCEVCGGPTTAATRCTNGRCATCHRLYCTAGGNTEPGHGRGWPVAFQVMRQGRGWGVYRVPIIPDGTGKPELIEGGFFSKTAARDARDVHAAEAKRARKEN